MFGVVDFQSIDVDIGRGNDPQPNLVAADLDDGNGDVAVDHDRFVFLAR